MNSICAVTNCQGVVTAKGYCDRHYRRFRVHGDPLGGRTVPGELTAFVEMAAKCKDEECLMWPFGRNSGGYGVVKYQGKQDGAHRVICKIVNGAPPTPEHQAAHSCGKGKSGCVNGSHLRWATPQENSDDKAVHQTVSRGESVFGAKLTETDVRAIRSTPGINQSEMAKKLGVTVSAVNFVVTGKTWRHVQ